jgi:signal transduction histidine kinase
MGLAMCKKIVEYHGGSIAVDTTYTAGARIAFTLPVLREESPQASPAPSSGES